LERVYSLNEELKELLLNTNNVVKRKLLLNCGVRTRRGLFEKELEDISAG
jgi:hypothetical protein